MTHHVFGAWLIMWMGRKESMIQIHRSRKMGIMSWPSAVVLLVPRTVRILFLLHISPLCQAIFLCLCCICFVHKRGYFWTADRKNASGVNNPAATHACYIHYTSVLLSVWATVTVSGNFCFAATVPRGRQCCPCWPYVVIILGYIISATVSHFFPADAGAWSGTEYLASFVICYFRLCWKFTEFYASIQYQLNTIKILF